MASSKKPPSADLAERLATFLQRHIPSGSHVLLGLSGGLDSRVLLDLLAKSPARLDFVLSALHVNHGISPNAGAWSDFCHRLCAAEQVPFKAIEVDIPRDSGLGLEAAARGARYAALLAEPADFVMLAHHRDDQAETLLLQLLRGAGVKGLAAMGECRHEGTKQIVRPLLQVPRSALLAYAETHGLQWIEDESNLDLAYDRNFLRHHVFPELEKRFPASRTTLARSASHLAEAAELLEELAALDAAGIIDHDRLALQALRQFSLPRARNQLRYWLSSFDIDAPPSVRLEEMLRQLLDARTDAQIRFRLGAYELRRYRDQAWLVVRRAETPGSLCLTWNGEDTLALDDFGTLQLQQATGVGVSRQKLKDGTVTIRLRCGGERFKPDFARPSRSLKSLLQDSGVPPWQRETLPLLYCGEELVAVPGVGVACGWQAGAGEEGLFLVWAPG